MTAYTPGLLALASGELARYAHSRTSIEGILRPEGSKRFTVTGLSLAENWNDAAATLLSQPTLQWMLLLNDDHDYAPDTLLKLLDRMIANDCDVVTGLYFERAVPFGPVLYESAMEYGTYTRRFLRPTDGETIEVDACGDGCMLVHRRVIEKLSAAAQVTGRPIWELGYGDGAARAQSNHDMCVCDKVRRAGFTITADLTVRPGHTLAMTVYPDREPDGQWTMVFRPRPDRLAGLKTAAPTGDEAAV